MAISTTFEDELGARVDRIFALWHKLIERDTKSFSIHWCPVGKKCVRADQMAARCDRILLTAQKMERAELILPC